MMMFEIAVNPTMSLISLRDIWSLGSVVLSLSCIIYYWRTSTIHFPASIPWVGVRNEAFSKSRAWIREFTAGLGTVQDGYHTVRADSLSPWRIMTFLLHEID